MSFSVDSSTRLSFLVNLSDSENRQEVWPQFAETYGKAIYRWSLKWGASPFDAEDIVQQTLLTVFIKVKQFKHGGRFSFRAWLRQIARYTWMNILEKSMRTELLPVDDVDWLISKRQLKSPAAREDLINRFDQLACEEIRDLAFAVVRERVSEQTWSVFLLFEHESRPADEIAEQFGMTAGGVRLAAFRVRKLLNQEVALIDPSLTDLL